MLFATCHATFLRIKSYIEQLHRVNNAFTEKMKKTIVYVFLIGTILLPAMKIREDWILGIVVEHPNLPTVATAQSRCCPSYFVEVIFHDWNSYFAEFFKIDFS